MTGGRFGYDRGTFGHKIGKDHVSNCSSYVIPDVCHRESTPFESIVFSGYPIKAFGYDRGRFGYDRGEVRGYDRGAFGYDRESFGPDNGGMVTVQ